MKDERDDLLKDLTEKRSLHAKLLSELEEYKSCDPEHVESLSEPFIIKKPLYSHTECIFARTVEDIQVALVYKVDQTMLVCQYR